jgi:hypothetical protein
MKVPTAGEIAKKWARVTPERVDDYEAGVRNPSKNWETETKAAEGNYEAGTSKAMTRKAFGKGVAKAGLAKQQGNSISKGIPRFGEGVRMGEAAMAAGMEGVVKVLSSLSLPPHYPTGDPRNYERGRSVGEALHKWKIGG